MNAGNRKEPGKRIVCFCYGISEEEIIAAIKNGATTLMEVRRETNANTGCGGCGEDVKKLLRKYATQAVQAEPESESEDG